VDVVDNTRFAAAASVPLSARPRAFLFVGRLIEKKGLSVLLEAYKRYRELSEHPWLLKVVGDGPLRALVESTEIGGVHYLGPLFGEELIGAYREAQCVVVPSNFEQWGLVVNEACASGAVVLSTTHCGAALALIGEGENGWLFGPGDAATLADLMLRVEGLGSDIDRMGQSSSAKVDRLYPVELFAAGVESAMSLHRRGPAGFFSLLATTVWNGRVAIR
jgi:glycosyltransferase involved in cell wall biosynthesis